MKIKWIIAPLVCSFLMSACASAPAIDTFSVAEVHSKIEVSDSIYEPHILLKGMRVGNQKTKGLTLDTETFWLQTAIVRETKEVGHAIHVVITYHQNWRYYERAAVIGGVSRPLTVLQRQVENCTGNMFVGCQFREHVVLSYSDADIRMLIDNEAPLHFQVQSRIEGIDMIVHLPVSYLRAQTLKAEEIINELGSLQD